MSAAAPALAAERRLRALRRLDVGGLVLTLATLALAIVWAFPLIAAAVATGTADVETPNTGALSWFLDLAALYGRTLFGTSLGRWYINSLVTSTGVAVVVIAISATCGYALSQLRFHGRMVLWLMILASFMIPTQALIISHFFLMNSFGLINTWPGVILPQLITPVAVIVYKQFFDQMPREFREAAAIDGASHAQILLRVFLPINWGVTASLAIITFIGAWNAFLWPFLAVTRDEMMNVSVGIGTLRDNLDVGYLTAALLGGLPVAVVYLLFQGPVTRAIVLSAGIKG